MELTTATPCSLFFLLLLLFHPHTGEARLCEWQSHGFKGTCLNDNNCGLICLREGFVGGRCRGFWRKCFCTKPCL
ncbi:hypothetical protein HPP92_012773 [Vanilla planifolia]|uniref:Knottins-like domain-containing protein n=1 Tax=Vanilla planifolia TaxID=51239 RepID=A0A835QST0_VANPL|nr:hypothetical protein HPP92_012773 [Vanilla planifolia]